MKMESAFGSGYLVKGDEIVAFPPKTEHHVYIRERPRLFRLPDNEWLQTCTETDLFKLLFEKGWVRIRHHEGMLSAQGEKYGHVKNAVDSWITTHGMPSRLSVEWLGIYREFEGDDEIGGFLDTGRNPPSEQYTKEEFHAYIDGLERARREYVDRHLELLGPNPAVAVFQQRNRESDRVQYLYYIHKTAHSGRNKWQLSSVYIDESGRNLPTGHEIYNTLEEALTKLHYSRAELVEVRRTRTGNPMDAEKIREWLEYSPPPNPKHDMTLGWIDEQGQWICPECSSRLTGRGCSYATRGTKPTYDQAGLPCIGCGKSMNPPDENDFEDADTGCASAVDARTMLAESRTVRADFEPQQYAVAANPEFKPKPDAYKIYRRLKAGRPITAKFLELSHLDMIGEVDTRYGASVKLGKSKKEGFWTPGLYLASGTVAGFNDLCPFASDRCRENCLLAAGRRQQMADFTALKIIGILRRGKPLTDLLNVCLLRTYLYLFNYPEFVRLMDKALAAHSALADENNFELAVRLNGTSDVAWEDPNVEPHNGHSIVLAHPEIHFYDYTKNPNRALRFAGDTSWPKNYYLTFSYSEINLAWCLILLRMGVNITVPFDGSFGSEEYGKVLTTPTGGKFRRNRPKLPRSLFGRDVVDGDAFDMRFLDATDYWQQQGFGPPPYVAGLRPKGAYARRRMDQNWFFFDAAMAQSHGADPEFISDQVYQNTRECIRQGQSDTLPGGDLLDLLDPTAREAFAMARKEG